MSSFRIPPGCGLLYGRKSVKQDLGIRQLFVIGLLPVDPLGSESRLLKSVKCLLGIRQDNRWCYQVGILAKSLFNQSGIRNRLIKQSLNRESVSFGRSVGNPKSSNRSEVNQPSAIRSESSFIQVSHSPKSFEESRPFACLPFIGGGITMQESVRLWAKKMGLFAPIS